MRLLLVEDEERLRELLARGLRRQGMAVDAAADGEEALRKAAVNRYDVVVLDRDLPGIAGDTVCERLGGGEESPAILMLTASGSVEDRVQGFLLGADDYLPKPFAFPELVLRVQALARRRATRRPPVLRHRDLEMDVARREARRAGRRLDLGSTEFGVLRALLAADGAVLSAERLLESVWDEHADPFSNRVAVTVMRLRRKLGEPQVIETVPGAGYRLA